MHFADPHYLYLLLLLVPLALVLQLGHLQRRRSQRLYAEIKLLKPLKPETRTLNRFFRNGLTLLAVGFVIVAMARPQIIRRQEVPSQQLGCECIFAIDISNSMLAEDLRPNRLDFAKLTMQRVIRDFGASQVGLVVFAGSAFTHLPLTSDIATAQSFIAECSPTMLSNQGTAIAPALERAAEGFSDRRQVGKAIFLFTDGENHESEAVEAAKEVAASGIKVFTIALGSPEGALIPTDDGYLKDAQGETVLSKANPAFCRDIAEAGQGAALTGSNVSSLSRHILDAIKEMPQAAMDGSVEEHDELFGQFLAIATLLLVLSFFIPFRKSRLFSHIKLFDR